MKPITKQITPIVSGYQEHLPTGYDGVKKLPLVLFLHGLGEIGNESSDLPKILLNGIPMYINKGFNPDFIMIAPQFSQWPHSFDIDQVLTWVMANYVVDASRVYLTGLSMGGGATWEYISNSETFANKVAAIVPVCGAYKPDQYGMSCVAKTGLPVLATHNSDDLTVPLSNTNGWVDGINAKAPKVSAIKIIWSPTSPATPLGHNAWARTYDPTNTEFGGKNIYDWMLQFSRPQAVQPPVVTPPPIVISTPYVFQFDTTKITCYSDGTWKKTSL